MLALVKKPRTEISIQGEGSGELVDWLRKKYDVAVLAEEPEDELVPIESTGYWQEMEKIEREINPHIFSPEEFFRRLTEKDPFLVRVISAPKLFIKGDEDDLGAVGA